MYTKFPNRVERDDGSVIPFDEENTDYRVFIEWAADNEPAMPPAPTFEQRAAAMLAAVDAHLNAAAHAKGYDSILSAALRAALPVSPFHAEGVAFGTWMDLVYAKCYEVLAQVMAGAIPEPTADELLAMLPDLQLPAD